MESSITYGQMMVDEINAVLAYCCCSLTGIACQLVELVIPGEID